MLDVEGTLNGIDDEKARLFIRSLDVIRKKFQADYGTIAISTHANNAREIKRVIDIFLRNLSDSIKIGTSFFCGGVYDYKENREISRHPRFNFDKVTTFKSYYVNSFGFIGTSCVWYAIFDDELEDSLIANVDRDIPVLLAKPSTNSKDVAKNDIMAVSSTSKGFDGVLEIMSTYLKTIHDLTPKDIVQAQKNLMMHLSSYNLTTKIIEKDYIFLKRYFEEGYADEDDYKDALDWLIMTNRNKVCTTKELSNLIELLELICAHFHDIGYTAAENKAKTFQNAIKEK